MGNAIFRWFLRLVCVHQNARHIEGDSYWCSDCKKLFTWSPHK